MRVDIPETLYNPTMTLMRALKSRRQLSLPTVILQLVPRTSSSYFHPQALPRTLRGLGSAPIFRRCLNIRYDELSSYNSHLH